MSFFHFQMTKDSTRRLTVTLCNCGGMFQGDNFRKHCRGKEGHAKESAVRYCTPCNKWAQDGEEFSHDKCAYVRLSKANLSLVLQRQSPLEREKLVAAVEAARLAHSHPSTGRAPNVSTATAASFSESQPAAPAVVVPTAYQQEVNDALTNIGAKPLRQILLSPISHSTPVGGSEADEGEELDESLIWAPSRKRKRLVDLDSSSSSEEEPAAKERAVEQAPEPEPSPSQERSEEPAPVQRAPPKRASGPCLPRVNSVHPSVLTAKENLVSLNSRFSKRIQTLEEDLKIARGRRGMRSIS